MSDSKAKGGIVVLTIFEAGKYLAEYNLASDPISVMRFIREKKLTAVRITNKKNDWRIPVEELFRFIQNELREENLRLRYAYDELLEKYEALAGKQQGESL